MKIGDEYVQPNSQKIPIELGKILSIQIDSPFVPIPAAGRRKADARI